MPHQTTNESLSLGGAILRLFAVNRLAFFYRYVEFGPTGVLPDEIGRIRKVTGRPAGFKYVVGARDWLKKRFREIRLRGAESVPDFTRIDSADVGGVRRP